MIVLVDVAGGEFGPAGVDQPGVTLYNV